MLIAGDLYDGDWRDYNTGLYLVRQLGRLRDHKIPVFVIAGNHDAANKMTRALRLPENVRFLTHERPETVHLEELGVAIHGQSFAKAAVMENLAAAYPAPVTWLHQHRAAPYRHGRGGRPRAVCPLYARGASSSRI